MKIFTSFTLFLIIFSFSQAEDTWQKPGVKGNFTSVQFHKGLFAGTAKGEICKKAEGKPHWDILLGGLPGAVMKFWGKDETVVCGIKNKDGKIIPYLSSENGQKWTQIYGDDVKDLIFQNSSVFYIIVFDNNINPNIRGWYVYKTEDSGKSWTEIYFNRLEILGMEVSGSDLFVCAVNELAHSGNEGKKWNKLWEAEKLQKADFFYLDEKKAAHLIFSEYKLTEKISSKHVKYNPQKQNWEIVYQTQGGDIFEKIFYRFGNLFYLQKGSNGRMLILSLNGGADRRIVYGGQEEINYAFMLGNNDIFMSKGGETQYSDDFGKSWKKTADFELNENNFSADDDNSIAACPEEKRGIIFSDSKGAGWSIINRCIANDNLSAVAVYKDIIYAGFKNMDGIFKSEDGGISWQSSLPKTFGEEIKSDISVQFFKSYDNPGFFAGTNRGLYKYDEKDMVWKNIRKDYHKYISLDKDSKGYIYALLEDAKMNKLFYSMDNGAKWQEINTWSNNFEKIFVDKKDIIWAVPVGKKGLYQGESGGKSWYEEFTEEDAVFKDITESDDALFAASDKGVYKIKDGKISLTGNKDAGLKKITFKKDKGLYAFGKDKVSHSKYGASWIDADNSGINADISDMFIDIERILISTQSGLLAAAAPFSDMFWSIRIHDIDSIRIPGRPFRVWKHIHYGFPQEYLGEYYTSSEGAFALRKSDIERGHFLRIYLDEYLHEEPAAKPGHSAVDNVMYKVSLNNLDFRKSIPFYHIYYEDRPQDIYMISGTYEYNLIVSVEWDAKREVLEAIEDWFKDASNYLFDVTDGHLFFNKVVVYDNKQHWDDCDIRFYANNTQWPCARVNGIFDPDEGHVHLPRRFFDSKANTIYILSEDDWYLRDAPENPRMIGHELGHYMMGFKDEYEDDEGNSVFRHYNFGFMDCDRSYCDNWSSEMSTPDRYPDNSYKITEQWSVNGMDCWSQWNQEREGTYEGIPCPIRTPEEDGRSAPERGPGDGRSSRGYGFEVDHLLDFEIHDFIDDVETGDLDLTIYSESGSLAHRAMVSHVKMISDSEALFKDQGKTREDGKIKVVGAAIGDVIWVLYQNPWTGEDEFSTLYIDAVSKMKKDNQILEKKQTLKKVAGEFGIVPQWDIQADGSLIIDFYMENMYPGGGTLTSVLEKSSFDIKMAAQKENYYTAEVNKNYMDEGKMFISAKDNEENEFKVPFDYGFYPKQQKIFENSGLCTLYISSENKVIDKFGIASSQFSTIPEGFNDGFLKVSPLYSISAFPLSMNGLTGKNIIKIKYDDIIPDDKNEENICVFMWNTGKRAWENLGGRVDTAGNYVSTIMNGLGSYLAVLDGEVSGINQFFDSNIKFEMYPNPAENIVSMQYYLPSPGEITLELFNTIGNKVSTLLENHYSKAGFNTFQTDLSHLSDGVYIAVLKTKSGSLSKKLIIAGY